MSTTDLTCACRAKRSSTVAPDELLAQIRLHKLLVDLVLELEEPYRSTIPTAGTVTIRFTLIGEPGVGGLPERVEIVDKDTTITQQTIHDCLTQQLYALELDPPPDGVTIERAVSLKVP